jgi:hypothetical protein
MEWKLSKVRAFTSNFESSLFPFIDPSIRNLPPWRFSSRSGGHKLVKYVVVVVVVDDDDDDDDDDAV